MSRTGKPRCPHCARKIAKGRLADFCPHCGSSTEARLTKAFTSEPDPNRREAAWQAAMAPFVAKAQPAPEPAPGPTLEQLEARWGQVTADYQRADPVLRKAESDLTPEQARERLLTKYQRDAQALDEPALLTSAEKTAMTPPRRSPSFITKAGA